MTYYNIGDRVRLRDGMLSWITKREGWTVEDSYNGYGLICEGGGVTVSVPWSEIEPESPSIPPEPPRVVGQAWRDAEGRTVVGSAAIGASRDYGVIGPNSGTFYYKWDGLDHPLTPLYPVPDPDDDEAVKSLRQRTNLAYHNGTKYWPADADIRAILRALREQS